jgi:hypothetical protein
MFTIPLFNHSRRTALDNELRDENAIEIKIASSIIASNGIYSSIIISEDRSQVKGYISTEAVRLDIQ